ncbi:MAG: hypothetical protein JHC74_15860, partial [Thermoleophilia bacterium]|nr:hypothetical protein [Thermoleophilia bacterium]
MSAPAGPGRSAGRRGLLLTSAEPGRRNRRTIDALVLALASFLCAWLTAVAAAAPSGDQDLADAARTLLGWAPAAWRASVIGAIAMASLVIVEAAVRRRWALVRDLSIALALVAGVGTALGRIVEAQWIPADAELFGLWGFPELRIAAVAAVVSVAGPELIRPVRLGAGLVAGLAALGLIALGAALPSAVLGAVALGLGVGALVRLVFGSAAGLPHVAEVNQALGDIGVQVRGLAPSARQRIGAADFTALDDGGRPLRIRVLGRDAQDTQRIARRWRALAYRDPPRQGSVGRLEQVEHEALATVLAGQAGVRTPEVATAALGPYGDALLVTRQPDSEPLESTPVADVHDAMLAGLWTGVVRLHAAGIAHGRLHAGNVVVADGECMIIDLAAATLGSPASARDTDVAELLVSTAALLGPERALRAALDGAGAPALAAALPYIQPAALTPHTRDRARAGKVKIAALR